MNQEKQTKLIELKKWCNKKIYELKCERERIGRKKETKHIMSEYVKCIVYHEDVLRQIAKETGMK